jgi:hypothetical protein
VLRVLLLAAAAVVDARPGRVTIDWTAGLVEVVGAGATDLRAPSPAIGRVTAERAARADGARRLVDAVKDVPLADGRTAADAAHDDPAAAARLAAVLARPRDVSIAYASDGSTEVTLAVPLEAVRDALAVPKIPRATDDSPTALVVDARALAARPALGVRVGELAGPTIWTTDAADPRAGARPLAAHATGYANGAFVLDVDPGPALAAGALVIVLVKP